jgi:hypothetical protein
MVELLELRSIVGRSWCESLKGRVFAGFRLGNWGASVKVKAGGFAEVSPGDREDSFKGGLFAIFFS